MSQAEIFGPVFAMVGLTFVVWVYMYARRIHFVQQNRIEPGTLTPEKLAQITPPAVSNPSDNLKNLFEIPVIFYVLALYLFATSQVDDIYLIAAWVFAAFRILHSAVHCTMNIAMLRFYLYAISTVSVWFTAGRAALQAF